MRGFNFLHLQKAPPIFIIRNRLSALLEILFAGGGAIRLDARKPATLRIILIGHGLSGMNSLYQPVLTLCWLCHAHVHCVNSIIVIGPAIIGDQIAIIVIGDRVTGVGQAFPCPVIVTDAGILAQAHNKIDTDQEIAILLLFIVSGKTRERPYFSYRMMSHTVFKYVNKYQGTPITIKTSLRGEISWSTMSPTISIFLPLQCASPNKNAYAVNGNKRFRISNRDRSSLYFFSIRIILKDQILLSLNSSYLRSLQLADQNSHLSLDRNLAQELWQHSHGTH